MINRKPFLSGNPLKGHKQIVQTQIRRHIMYGTMAAHTRCRAFVLVMFVVFCVHVYSFAVRPSSLCLQCFCVHMYSFAVRPSSLCFWWFCVYTYSFAGLIRRTPPPTFSDTATTDRHSDTSNFQLRAHWMRVSWSFGSEKSFGHVLPVGVEPSTSSLSVFLFAVLLCLFYTICSGLFHCNMLDESICHFRGAAFILF